MLPEGSNTLWWESTRRFHSTAFTRASEGQNGDAHPFAVSYWQRWSNLHRSPKSGPSSLHDADAPHTTAARESPLESSAVGIQCTATLSPSSTDTASRTSGGGDGRDACEPCVPQKPRNHPKGTFGSPDTRWTTVQQKWWRILQVESLSRAGCTTTTTTIPHEVERSECGEAPTSKTHSHEGANDGRAALSSTREDSAAHSSFTACVDAHGSVAVTVKCTDNEEERCFLPVSTEEGGVPQRTGTANLARFLSVRSSEEEMHVTKTLRALHVSITAFHSRSSPATVSAPSIGRNTSGRGKPSCSLVSLVVFTASTFQRCVELSTGVHATTSPRTSTTTTTTFSDLHPTSHTPPLRDGSPPPSKPEPTQGNGNVPRRAIQAETSPPSSFGKESVTVPAGSTQSPFTVHFSPAAAASTLLYVLSRNVVQKELRQLVWGVLRLQHRYLQDAGMELSELLEKVQALEWTDSAPSSPSASVSPHRSPSETLSHAFLLSSVAPSSWSRLIKSWLGFSKSMIHVRRRPGADTTTRPPSECGAATSSGGSRCPEVEDAASLSPSPPLGVQGKDEEKESEKVPFSATHSSSPLHIFPCVDGPIYPRVDVCSAHHMHHFHFFFPVSRESSSEEVGRTPLLATAAAPPAPPRTSSSTSSRASVRPQNEVDFSAWMGRPTTTNLYAQKKEHEAHEKNEKKDGRGDEEVGSSPSHSKRPPAQGPPQGRGVNGPFPFAEAMAILRRMTDSLSCPPPVTSSTLDTVPSPRVAAVHSISPRMRQTLTSCARSTLWTFLSEVSQFRIALAYFLQMEMLLQEVKTVTTVWNKMDTPPHLSSPPTHPNTKGGDKISSVQDIPPLFFMKVEENQLRLVDELLHFILVTSDETSRILDGSRHWGRFLRKAQLRDAVPDEKRMEADALVGKDRLPFLSTSLSSENAHPSTPIASQKDTPDGPLYCSYSTVEEIFKCLVDMCKERREEYLQRYSDPHRFSLLSTTFKME